MSGEPLAGARLSHVVTAAALVLLAWLALAAPANAGRGFKPDSSQPSIALDAEIPGGVAVDQASEEIYVAELSKALVGALAPGEVEQLTAEGAPTANSPFGTGGQDFFLAVAVNPATHGIYAYQAEASTPLGQKGTSEVSGFSSTGVLGTSFPVATSGALTLAADAAGHVLFPNTVANTVQAFDSSGALAETISCAGCPVGSFDEPDAVAFDSGGDLYVVSRANGKVVKLAPSGGGYTFASTLQSGAGAVAVAVDTSSGDVFVGDWVGGEYHVAAFDSAATQFDDFGAGLVKPSIAEGVAGQLAVDSTSHRVLLSDPGGDQLWAFEPVGSIPAPTASIAVASPVGQVEATLRATVNPKGHVLTTCHFEYTTHADFLANGYANAKVANCPAVVGDRESTTISAAVSGLSPATRYDYRIQIASFGGSAESGPEAFETLPAAAPEATTGSASAVTKTTATLNGSVNPKGGKTTNCHFEYVTEASFLATGFSGATVKTCSPTPTGNVTTAVLAKLTGLPPGTTYRFRVVATNNAGTTQAPDKAFATVAETCAENAALCPPPPGESTPPPAESPFVSPLPSAPKPLKCHKGFKKKRVHGKLKCVRAKKSRRG
jgi:hypothetical protein